MTVAAVRPTGRASHANRWLIAAVITLAAALVALGVYTLVHEETPAVQPVKTTNPPQTLDQGQMQALVMNRQDAQNSRDAAKLASFYTADAMFYDVVTNTTLHGSQEIGKWLADAARIGNFAYRAEGGPYVVGDNYLVVPFSLPNPKNMAKHAGVAAQRIEVLEIKDGKIASDIGYALYNQQ